MNKYKIFLRNGDEPLGIEELNIEADHLLSDPKRGTILVKGGTLDFDDATGVSKFWGGEVVFDTKDEDDIINIILVDGNEA